MYFGANTFIWESPFTTRGTKLFDHIKALGFDAIEIAVEDPTLIEPKVVKHELERTGLRGIVCGVFPPTRDISSDDPLVRQTGFEYLKWCIDFAALIGSPIVGGPMYSCVGKARILPPEERRAEIERSAENLFKLCEYAAPREVRLAMEPINRFETDMINTVKQGLEMIQLVNHPNLGLHLDTFHMHLEEKDSAAAIRAAGDRVFHVHAAENDRGIPGSGQVQWQAIAKALKDIGYNGAVVIESFTPEVKSIAQAVCIWREIAPNQDAVAVEGLRFLKQLFA